MDFDVVGDRSLKRKILIALSIDTINKSDE